MARPVRFLLDGDVHELSKCDPTETVLQMLRERLGRTGTKEGCAEGDCGACTVAVTALEGGRPVTRAINSCIAFTPSLDGKALTTVESLGGGAAPLHPVQQAMVEAHASQCGFCTPGFVMSLYARQVGGAGTNVPLEDVLAGNLCRCTGYGPILAAGRAVEQAATKDHFESETIRGLEAIQARDPLALSYDCPLSGVTKRWFTPHTSDAFAALCEQYPNAVIVAGATDVGLWVTKQARVLETVISVGEIEELRQIRESGTAIEIGAGARYSDAQALLRKTYPDMGEVLRRLGSVQIRNSGTIGGNIANGSPIGDTIPLFIAAGATLDLRKGPRRRSLPLEAFFLAYGKQDRAPGEFIERIVLPKPAPGLVFKAYKISKRFDQDISSVLGAFAFGLEEGKIVRPRIAFGGMAEVPKRAAAAERALDDARATPAGIEPALNALEADFTPISDMRASAAYRIMLTRNLLRKAVMEVTGRPTAHLAVQTGGLHG